MLKLVKINMVICIIIHLKAILMFVFGIYQTIIQDMPL